MISHIYDAQSDDQTFQTHGARSFEQCREMMHELRDNHYSTDFALHYIEKVSNSIGRAVPSGWKVPSGMMSSRANTSEEGKRLQLVDSAVPEVDVSAEGPTHDYQSDPLFWAQGSSPWLLSGVEDHFLTAWAPDGLLDGPNFDVPAELD